MNELEEAILKQMEENEGIETEDESLTPTESENITKGNYVAPRLPILSKKGVGIIFDQIIGTQFKMGDAMFEIKSVNRGKHRFTAEILNEVVSTETDDIIGRNRINKTDDSNKSNNS